MCPCGIFTTILANTDDALLLVKWGMERGLASGSQHRGARPPL